MSSAADEAHMARAIALAERGGASSDPNPAVGCVIVKNGTVVGEGFTQRAGGNHAEIEALDRAGSAARGASCYVSLEPCAHQGRTGPCTRALIDAGVMRVVFAVKDPNPRVTGNGAGVLAAAGVAVEGGLLRDEARAVNRGFFSRMERHRPFISAKLAASLDGKTALANGQSQWITGEAARRDAHGFRARASAVMTGIGTILADDPALTARADGLAIDVVQPARVIVDSKLRTPATAKTLALPGGVIIFSGPAPEARRAPLARAGASLETVALETVPGAAEPRCDLAAVVRRLAELEINTVWLEAGPTLAGAMLAAGLVDELVLYLAPCLLGDKARDLLVLPEIETLAERWALRIDALSKIGEDLRVVARPVAD
jgi:diaminohydroxyphosphoribosylaminopyrimidine deaminase/5-amino-6-(5-phosphoribosylamino)uracil reductase